MNINPQFNLACLVWIIGLLFYLLTPTTHPRIIRMGEIMFAIGLFCWLFIVGK